MDRPDDVCVNTTSNYNDEVTLNVSLGPSTDLLELHDPMVEVAKTSDLGKNGELKVNFFVTKSKPAPVDVVIPTFMVPVVKCFRG